MIFPFVSREDLFLGSFEQRTIESSIEGCCLPRRFHAVPFCIGNNILDLHPRFDLNPSVSVCLHRSPLKASVSVGSPADPPSNGHQLWVCGRQCSHRLSEDFDNFASACAKLRNGCCPGHHLKHPALHPPHVFRGIVPAGRNPPDLLTIRLDCHDLDSWRVSAQEDAVLRIECVGPDSNRGTPARQGPKPCAFDRAWQPTRMISFVSGT